MGSPSLLVSRLETADLLGVSVRTIDRLCDGGELRRQKVRGRALVVRASIAEYLTRSAEQAAVAEQPRQRFPLRELEELKLARGAVQPRRAA